MQCCKSFFTFTISQHLCDYTVIQGTAQPGYYTVALLHELNNLTSLKNVQLLDT